jgi:hypothetical protein
MIFFTSIQITFTINVLIAKTQKRQDYNQLYGQCVSFRKKTPFNKLIQNENICIFEA